MAEWLNGVVPYMIALSVAAAVFGVARSKHRRMSFKISIASMALAGITFVLSVVIRSIGSMPV